MIDAFPYPSWAEVDGAFWQYSAGGTGAGTWTLTVIGMIVTFLALVGWVVMDDRMLRRHAERLRAAGFGQAGAASTDTESRSG